MLRTAAQPYQCAAMPWYTLNPRSIRARHILPVIAIFLLCLLVNEKHVWQWDWEGGIHALYNCHAVRDSAGRSVDAWRWVEGREIRVYYPPTMRAKTARFAAYNIAQLTRELGLSLTVHALPAPARVSAALARGTEQHDGVATVNFDRFSREMLTGRDGRYAEMVFAPVQIDGSADVVGAAVFNTGVSLIDPRRATASTARHEATHLLGYHMHDTWPLIVFGYPNPSRARYQLHFERDLQHGDDNPTLMTEGDGGYDLSDRAKDAVIHFWRGLERRTGQRYFTVNTPDKLPAK